MITISTNVQQVIDNLTDKQKRQIPFALSKALNQTALDVQAGLRRRITQGDFTIRSAASGAWLSRLVKINRGEWSSKNRLAPVRIGIGKGFATGHDRGTILPLTEEGGARFSKMQIGHASLFAAGSVAVPIRRTPNEQIPRHLYPSALGLQDLREASGRLYRAGEGSKSRRKKVARGQLKGTARTFVVRTKAGEGLILQRMSPNIARALFAIKPQVQVRGKKWFGSTALAVFNERFRANFSDALELALRTAR